MQDTVTDAALSKAEEGESEDNLPAEKGGKPKTKDDAIRAKEKAEASVINAKEKHKAESRDQA